MLQRLIGHMQTCDDVWFTTCEQAAAHARSLI